MSKVGTPIHDQKRTTKNPKKQSSAFVTSESRFFWRFFFSSRLSAVDCVIFRQDIKTWRQRKDADKLTTTAKVKRNRVEVVLDLFRYLEKWNISAVVSSPTRTFTREVGRHPMMNRYHFSQVTIFFFLLLELLLIDFKAFLFFDLRPEIQKFRPVCLLLLFFQEMYDRIHLVLLSQLWTIANVYHRTITIRIVLFSE